MNIKMWILVLKCLFVWWLRENNYNFGKNWVRFKRGVLIFFERQGKGDGKGFYSDVIWVFLFLFVFFNGLIIGDSLIVGMCLFCLLLIQVQDGVFCVVYGGSLVSILVQFQLVVEARVGVYGIFLGWVFRKYQEENGEVRQGGERIRKVCIIIVSSWS